MTVENEYNMPEGTRYHMWPTGHATIGVEQKWANEGPVLDYFIDYFNSFDGCEHRGYTKLEKLIVENGKVVGAYCSMGEDFDSYIRVNASKGVVVLRRLCAKQRHDDRSPARHDGRHRELLHHEPGVWRGHQGVPVAGSQE